MKLCPTILSCLVLGLLLGGCAGPASGSRTGAAGAGAGPDAKRKVERPPLRVGMAAEDVQILWGAPEAVAPVNDSSMQVELWIYPGRLRVQSTPVATTVRQVMAFNPKVEGGMIATPDPVYTIETRRFEEKIQVVMIDGRVADLLRVTRELPSTAN